MRGLGQIQIEMRNQTDQRVLSFLAKNEPSTASQMRSAKLCDKTVLSQSLTRLESSELVKKIFVKKNLRRGHYYVRNPFSEKIQELLTSEELPREYFYGIRDGIPVFAQIKEKISILEHEFSTRSLSRDSISRYFIKHRGKFVNRNLRFSSIIHILNPREVIDDFKQHIDFLDDKYVHKNVIDRLDGIAYFHRINRRDRKRVKIGDIEIIQMLILLMNTNPNGLKKKFGCGKKIIASVSREFINEDGSLKNDKIDQFHDRILGKSKYHVNPIEKLSKKDREQTEKILETLGIDVSQKYEVKFSDYLLHLRDSQD